MSTTLTNGLKLPDKGSVDWYADMQNNYSILDGAVGTIAEHTTALSGKAPLVHTHTKSDVTDLFNSANTWSGDNTYSKTVAIERSTDTGNFLALKNTVAELGSTPASAAPVTIAYRDKNDENLGYMGVYYDTDGSNHFRLYVRNKFTSGSPSTSGSADYAYFGLKLNADKSKEGILRASFRPYDNNTYDLGSSSYQWNNLYAKNYYYNGVAWGLDKENVWSQNNRFTKSISLGNITSYTDCSLGFTGLYNVLFFNTRGSSNIPSYGTYVYYGYSNISSDRGAIIRMVRTTDKKGDTNDGYIPDLSFNLYKISPAKLFIDFMEAVRVTNDGTENSLKPITTDITDLGTSTNKWKTLNGINPGALSLPSGASENINTDNWNFSWNAANFVTAPFDGYISIACVGSALQINNETKAYAMTFAPGADGFICGLLPVSTGDSIKVLVTRTQTSQYESYKFIKAKGNVS